MTKDLFKEWYPLKLGTGFTIAGYAVTATHLSEKGITIIGVFDQPGLRIDLSRTRSVLSHTGGIYFQFGSEHGVRQ